MNRTRMIKDRNEQESIILFDGVCNLCNGFVTFILSHESDPHFRFASLQSEFAQSLLANSGINVFDTHLETVYLYRNGSIYQKSTAVIEILRRLSKIGKMSVLLYIIPRFLRDFVYSIVARNRYRWMGKRESCMIPRPEWKERFLG